MRNRVKVINKKYVTKPQDKLIVCILKCDMQLDKHPAWMSIDEIAWKKRFPNVDLYGKFTVKATAKCNSNDVYNEQYGKNLAESRAKSKAFSIASKVYQSIEYYFLRLANSISESMEACDKAVEVEEDHIEFLKNM